ncbi:outer membrane protein transport protein [bacterium]|nr:outer membrane protein transport protein [bacterium]
MKKILVLSVTVLIGMIPACSAFAQIDPLSTSINFAFSPNPVGSGARALGYGAFIAIADDATAASWNPGGLIQLKKPEASIVGSVSFRNADNTFEDHPEGDSSYNVSYGDLNYFSFAYPFTVLNRKMVAAVNYQRLYDFNRDLNFKFDTKQGELVIYDDINQQQSGSLSAIGLAYSFEIIPRSLSLGLTLNIWDDDFSNNSWEQKISGSPVVKMGDAIVGGIPYIGEHKFILEGFNYNLGLLWRSKNRKISLGGVFKSPFTADLKHEFHAEQTGFEPNDSTMDEKLKMPMSYGIGAAYRISDSVTFSGDIYRTHWDDFIIEEQDGTERSAVTATLKNEADVDPTIQVRIGAEYLIINKTVKYVIPLRTGLFYDPAPAQGSSDNYYGISLGSGFAKGRYVLDVAMKYRFGRDVGNSVYPDYEFSQNVDEIELFMSLVTHF